MAEHSLLPSYALCKQDDGKVHVVKTGDGFGAFKTYDEAYDRAIEIMTIRRDCLQEGIQELQEEKLRKLIDIGEPDESQ